MDFSDQKGYTLEVPAGMRQDLDMLNGQYLVLNFKPLESTGCVITENVQDH